ncbi:hypothetical protein EAG14_12470 [Acidovorax sp. 1608163]|nr:hypothetical protein EAG14_12470 [Acidovorax sp. 1608163]
MGMVCVQIVLKVMEIRAMRHGGEEPAQRGRCCGALAAQAIALGPHFRQITSKLLATQSLHQSQ